MPSVCSNHSARSACCQNCLRENFRDYLIIQLSMLCCCLFSFVSDNLFSLSHLQVFVNNFFILFFLCFRSFSEPACLFYHRFHLLSSSFFSFFWLTFLMFDVFRCLADSFVSITHFFVSVNTIFTFFFIFLKFSISSTIHSEPPAFNPTPDTLYTKVRRAINRTFS